MEQPYQNPTGITEADDKSRASLVLWQRQSDGTFEQVPLDKRLARRCDPDPFRPGSIPCDAAAGIDDRQAVSHFFGRNKKATASIPAWCFPTWCRKHYQESSYRNKASGDYADLQCGLIQLVLENMSRLYWKDGHGLLWPMWCGFKLQVRMGAGRRSAVIPDWLVRLCDIQESTSSSTPCLFSFHQILLVVEKIQAWCQEENAALPMVEALPVTVGLFNQERLGKAKNKLARASRNRYVAINDRERLVKGGASAERLKAAEQRIAEATKTAGLAEEGHRLAVLDFNLTQITIPETRRMRRVGASPTEQQTGQIE